MILADSAEVINGKLYMLGGGWDALTINSGFPRIFPVSIAVAFRVPWNDTNQPHAFAVEVQDADGKALASVTGDFEVGRPAGIPAGLTQITQIAVRLAIPLSQPGTHVIIGRIGDQELKRTPFVVVAPPTARL